MEAGVLTADLKRLVVRFQHWRRSRSRGERIPDELWDSATVLAREEGVSPVARALVLDYYRLKERVESLGVSRVSAIDSPSFVEVAVDPARSPCGREIEVQRKDGTKLLIRSSAESDLDLRDLVLSFSESSR